MSIDASTPEVTRAGTVTATDPRAAALMRTLDRLVGTWTVSGPDELSGEVRYEWMDGGSFVVQHVNLCSAVERTRGVEYIGYDEVSGELRSHFFGAGGEIQEYTYRLQEDLLTICSAERDSPARIEGRFSADGRTNLGAWQWPRGWLRVDDDPQRVSHGPAQSARCRPRPGQPATRVAMPV